MLPRYKLVGVIAASVSLLAFAQIQLASDTPSESRQFSRSECHPSYQGACVPFALDVDCLGGRGDGPAYVGRVLVVGPDVYGLDRDHDGVGCEPASD